MVYNRFVCCFLLWLPLSVLGAPGPRTNTTFATSTSVGIGPTNATFVWITHTIGPAFISIGDFGTCTIPPGPYPNANCTLNGGSGTTADPFSFTCASPLALSGCSLPGTPFVVAPGYDDFDGHTHTQRAAVAALPAVPMPLGPWVPLGSAIGVALLALLWQSRLTGRNRNDMT